MSLRRVETGQRRVARTLSRNFWQQKNFHPHRLRVSSALAKTPFLSESPAPIRDARFARLTFFATFMMNDWCTRARSHQARRAGERQLPRIALTSETEFGLEQIVDGLRIGLAAG